MKPPCLSIILTCRNPGILLKNAVESVLGQETDNFELILVDAASTDGALELLTVEEKHRCRIICEPDRGVYEGMNKGLRLAQGTWVYFLGADDIFVDKGVLQDIIPLLDKTQAGLLVGRVKYEDGREYGGNFKRTIARSFLHHQATFYRRDLFERHGVYDERFRIQADYDFNLRLALSGTAIENTERQVAKCGCGGLSDGGKWANYREEIQIRHGHFPAWQCWVWDLGAVVRYLRKRLRILLKSTPE